MVLLVQTFKINLEYTCHGHVKIKFVSLNGTLYFLLHILVAYFSSKTFQITIIKYFFSKL